MNSSKKEIEHSFFEVQGHDAKQVCACVLHEILGQLLIVEIEQNEANKRIENQNSEKGNVENAARLSLHIFRKEKEKPAEVEEGEELHVSLKDSLQQEAEQRKGTQPNREPPFADGLEEDIEQKETGNRKKSGGVEVLSVALSALSARGKQLTLLDFQFVFVFLSLVQV